MTDFTTLLREAHARKNLEFPHTHTSFFPFASTLSVDDDEAFLDAYLQAVKDGVDVSVTEKTPDIFPFFVDVDLKVQWFLLKDNPLEAPLTEAQAFNVLREIISELQKSIDRATGNPNAEVTVALRAVYKAHIHFPGIFVEKGDAKLIVRSALSELRSRMGTLPWDSILDTKPYSSGLRLLGSTKGVMKNALALAQEKELHEQAGFRSPFANTYRVVAWDLPSDGFTFTEITREQLSHLSIRRRGSLTPNLLRTEKGDPVREVSLRSGSHPLKANAEKYIAMIQSAFPQTVIDRRVWSIKQYDDGNICVELPPQACPFDGVKHNRTLERGVSTAHLFIRPNMTQLRCWACEGRNKELPKAPEGLLFARTAQYGEIQKVLDFATCEAVSEFIIDVLGNLFAASPCGTGFKWYYYDSGEHRWVQQERILLAIMGRDGPVQSALDAYRTKEDAEKCAAAETDMDGASPLPVTKRRAGKENKKEGDPMSVKALMYHTQMTGYVHGSIMPLLARKYDARWRKDNQTFEEQLDQDPHLLGCSNGVYDFRSWSFRDGSPSDMISMSTHVPYAPFERQPEEIRNQVQAFLRQIFTKEDHREYFMRELGASLRGTQERQHFFLLTGRGANGKSTLMNLKSLSLGDYAGEAPVTMFTQPRPPAEDATPALMNMRGKRTIDTSEPESSTPFVLGAIKLYTGGDKVTGRRLKENTQSFYLQCTIFCQTNDIPPIKASRTDFGSWRRFKPVCFESRFLPNPDPSNPLEFQTDPDIKAKLSAWKGCFLALLIDYCKKGPLDEPPAEFQNLSKELQGKADIYSRFLEECTKRDEGSFTDLRRLYQTFTAWVKGTGTRTSTTRDGFITNLADLLGKPLKGPSGLGYKVQVLEDVDASF
jgi:P4 family phage/plasmid primase-like protien